MVGAELSMTEPLWPDAPWLVCFTGSLLVAVWALLPEWGFIVSLFFSPAVKFRRTSTVEQACIVR